jgi:hypothetical protein
MLPLHLKSLGNVCTLIIRLSVGHRTGAQKFRSALRKEGGAILGVLSWPRMRLQRGCPCVIQSLCDLNSPPVPRKGVCKLHLSSARCEAREMREEWGVKAISSEASSGVRLIMQ